MSGGTVYQPELLFWDGELREGLSLEVGADGRVVGVTSASVPGAVPLRRKALLPGLVNGHSHAFQRLIRGRTEYAISADRKDDFWSWRERMYQAAVTLGPEELFVATRHAFLEMAKAGITTVGEFHYLHHQPDGTPYEDRNELAEQVLRAAREVGLRICLLRVGYARAGFQVPQNPRQRRFIDPDVETFLATTVALAGKHRTDPLVSVGLAPHSVRAVPREWLEALRDHTGVVHMHIAEQPAEIAACRAEHQRTPVELVDDLGLLKPGFTAVHGVHLEEHEIACLGRRGVSVCACPSTERNLGDGIVAADLLAAAGVNLALGSDSQIQIDLLAEARQLEGHLRLWRQRRAVLDPGGARPSGLAARLLGFASAGGARSLGVDTGVLAPGKPADFFTYDLSEPAVLGLPASDALAGIVFAGQVAGKRDVYVAGKAIVKDGHHVLEEESAQAFVALGKKVFA